MTKRHVPDKFHPGGYLIEELDARGMTEVQFASRCAEIGLGDMYILSLLRELVPITRPVAVGLEILLGSSAEMWMNLQREYDR